MSKIQIVIALVIAIALSYSFVTIKKQRERLDELDRKTSVLWFEKLADYQYLSNTTYRDLPQASMNNFLDSLNGSLDLMMKLSFHEELSAEDKDYISGYLFSTLSTFNSDETEVLELLEISHREELYVGTDFEILERLERVINPYLMTRCKEFQNFDIYEKQDSWEFGPGDTLRLMVRLLSNYSLQSHETELVPSSSLELVNPYFGEITHVVPADFQKGGWLPITFQTYDWISRDTVEQSVILTSNDFGK